MSANPTLTVLSDRVVEVASVTTVASDEWRAAVVLRGELDVATAAMLGAELDRHLSAGRRVIRIDMRAVEFMDSVALAEILSASERCSAGHGSLILTGVPPRLRRLFALIAVDQVLLIDSAGDRDER